MESALCFTLLALVFGFVSAAFNVQSVFQNSHCSGSPVSVSATTASCTPSLSVNCSSIPQSVNYETVACVNTVVGPSGYYARGVSYSNDPTCSDSSKIVGYAFAALDTCYSTDQIRKVTYDGTQFITSFCSDNTCASCRVVSSQPAGACIPSLNIYIKYLSPTSSACSTIAAFAILVAILFVF